MKALHALRCLPFLLLGCSSQHGGIMLGMSTDLVVPEDIDAVALYIQHLDESRVVERWSFTAPSLYDPARNAYVVRFPATLAIESNGVGTDRVRVRAVAFSKSEQGLVPVVLREARTQVPTDHVALLRLPLLWINEGTASDTQPFAGLEEGDAFSRFGSGCPDEMTRGDDGVCTGIDVPLGSLPRFEAAPATCFDPEAVFRAGSGVLREPATRVAECTLPLDRSYDPQRAQVALVTGSGYAVGAERVRPLAQAAYRIEARQLRLLPGACEALRTASAVLVSDRVEAESVETVCSPWQDEAKPVDVRAPEPLVDSGAPDATPPPDASDAGVVDTWALDAAPTSWTVAAGGVYVAVPEHILRYPLTPGPALRDVTTSAEHVQSRGVDANGVTILYGDQGSALFRLDPVTLAATPATFCAASGECVTAGVDAVYEPEMGVQRGGNDRLYVAVWEDHDGTALYNIYSTALDGVSGSRLDLGGAIDPNGVAESMLAVYPVGTGLVWVKRIGSGYARYDCGDTGCIQGTGYSAPSFDGLGGITSASSLESGSVFAYASWNTRIDDEIGNVAGVTRLDPSSALSLVYATYEDVRSVVRKGDDLCWRSSTTLTCMNAAVGAASVHAVTGVVLGSDLQSDASYVYWLETDGTTLRRRAWSTLF